MNKRMATAKHDFDVGEFFTWEGEPFASMIVRSQADTAVGAAVERVHAGQVVEITPFLGVYAARLATPDADE